MEEKIIEKFPIRTETWFSNAMIILDIQSHLPYWPPVLRTMWQWKPFQLPLVFQIIKNPDRQNDKSLKLQGIQAPNRRFNSLGHYAQGSCWSKKKLFPRGLARLETALQAAYSRELFLTCHWQENKFFLSSSMDIWSPILQASSYMNLRALL